MITLNNTKYYSREEVIKLLDIHPRTLGNFISKGWLPVHRPSHGLTYITEEQVEAFICRNSSSQPSLPKTCGTLPSEASKPTTQS